ncbi:hypothetical protein ACFO0M_27630 [Micromonospora mangrovi]|uniref:Uncharacterized protein n=2 Tax=Micromonospora TaxID=1873 RepID=A0AAU8HIE4_9ACTN
MKPSGRSLAALAAIAAGTLATLLAPATAQAITYHSRWIGPFTDYATCQTQSADANSPSTNEYATDCSYQASGISGRGPGYYYLYTYTLD